MKTARIALLALAACASGPELRQRGDASFQLPNTGPPAFAADAGPRVGIDEAHHNYHTASGRYRAFAELLRRDGYRVSGFDSEFTPESLVGVDVLVISNAVSAENENDWSLPNHSAFTDAEIAAVRSWVAGGGRLLLIADHMPMPGAAEGLAAAFGIEFHDGFAFGPDERGRMTFSRDDGSLADHAVTRDVPFVTTFTGQAFGVPANEQSHSLMQLANDAYLLLPQEAWKFSETTPRISAAGLSQGTLIEHGRGRVAVFGEAAQFSAQVSGESARPMGMNHPAAPHNARFLLNVMGWLSEGT